MVTEWDGVMVVIFYGDELRLARRAALRSECEYLVHRAWVFRRRGERARSARLLARAAEYRRAFAKVAG